MKKLILLIPTVLSLNGNDCAGIKDTIKKTLDIPDDRDIIDLLEKITTAERQIAEGEGDTKKLKRNLKIHCDAAENELKGILQDIGAHFDKKELSTIFGLMVAEQAASSASPIPPPPLLPKVGTPPPPPPPPPSKAVEKPAVKKPAGGKAQEQQAKKQEAGGQADVIAQLKARLARMGKAMRGDEDQAEAEVAQLQPAEQKEAEKLVLDLKKYKDQIDRLADVRLGATAKSNFRKILEEMNKEYSIEAQFNEALGELKGYIDSSEHKHKAKLQETYKDWNKMS